MSKEENKDLTDLCKKIANADKLYYMPFIGERKILKLKSSLTFFKYPYDLPKEGSSIFVVTCKDGESLDGIEGIEFLNKDNPYWAYIEEDKSQ